MAKKIEKEIETTETVDETVVDGIVVKDPLVFRPIELPLVVIVPDDASLAQKEFAKVLNAYAYKNPKKWEIKKKILIEKLASLKNAPDPVSERLTYGTRNVLSR